MTKLIKKFKPKKKFHDQDYHGQKKGIPIELLISYRNMKLSSKEIARLIGCGQSNVVQRLKKAGYPMEQAHHYKEHEATIIALKKKQIAEKGMDEKKLKESSYLQSATAYGIMFDKGRILENKSTENIAINERVTQIDEDKDKLKLILEKIKQRTSPPAVEAESSECD
jgi:ABC-type phosphate transport system ATPase subunit|tara:strand:+ start:404 stop:907 length:504 start_codon:yes stop_codon:yes gene_type:complete